MTHTEMRSKNKSLAECTVIFIYWGKKYYYIICITLFWNVLIWLWILYTRSLRNWIFEKQRVLSFLCCNFPFFSPLHSVYCCIHSFIHFQHSAQFTTSQIKKKRAPDLITHITLWWNATIWKDHLKYSHLISHQ